MQAVASHTRIYKGSAPRESATSLSMLISGEWFSYCLFSDNHLVPVELSEIRLADSGPASYDLTARISFLVNNHQLSQVKYEKVYISILHPHFSLAPHSFMEAGNARQLLSFTTGLDQGSSSHHTVAGLDFNFLTDPSLLSELERRFNTAHIRHAGAVTIGLMLSHHAFRQADLYLSLHEGWMEIAAMKKGKVSFYNIFPYTGNEDILYYLLFQMEQSGLEPLLAKVVLSCQRSYDDPLIRTLAKYLKFLTLAVADPSLKMTGDFRSVPSHYYFTLLNQHLCEL